MNAPAEALSRAAQTVISANRMMTKNQPAKAPACRTPRMLATCQTHLPLEGHVALTSAGSRR